MDVRSFVYAVLSITPALTGNAVAAALALPQGADATFTVVARNPTSIDVARTSFESLQPPSFAWNGYALTASNSPTCVLGGGNLYFPLNSVALSTGPIPAHGSVRCLIGVQRGLASLYAVGLDFLPTADTMPAITLDDATWLIGPLADVSIRAHQIGPFPPIGGRVGFAEISVTNHGPLDVQHADFGFCQDSATAPFSVDAAVSDGCGSAYSGPVCFATGLDSVQFGVGALAPGQTKSCVLRLTALAPLQAPIGFPLYLFDDFESSTGEFPADSDNQNDFAALELAPRVSPAAPIGNAVAVLLPGLLVLVVLRASMRKKFSLARAKIPGNA